MINQPIQTAEQALAHIEVQRVLGLTPVMKGTSFYRHSFSASQFGSYVQYLDERGTRGCCQPKNLFRTFDFISLGQPVPGSFPDQALAPRAEPGYGMVIELTEAEAPARRALTLLEAAEAALMVMSGGPERDDLERAVAAERRTH